MAIPTIWSELGSFNRGVALAPVAEISQALKSVGVVRALGSVPSLYQMLRSMSEDLAHRWSQSFSLAVSWSSMMV